VSGLSPDFVARTAVLRAKLGIICHDGEVPAWLIWLIAAGVLAGAETLSLDFVLIMFAGGAAGASISAALGAPAIAQVLVAIAATLALLVFVRPVVRRHLAPHIHLTGSAALVGREAIVLSQVDEHGGRIRLNGQEWSARTFDQNQVLPAGTRVRVMQISGATAIVWEETPPPLR
jgi:membrane protein implicated in regulation of membrane protease activity